MPDAPAPAISPALPPPLSLDGVSLFFDFDGTLVELAEHPDAVVVDEALAARLDRLAERLGSRIAVVSGRSIAQLDALLGRHAHAFAIAGSHGAERRTLADGHLQPERPALLDAVDDRFEAFAAEHGLVFERKSLGSALHWRQVPEQGVAAAALAEALAAEHGLKLQHGKMMAELRTPGDKGAAIRALMAAVPAMAGTRPLFFGDDVTDEPGFAAAAALGGAGVLIGPPRDTAALHRLDGVAALAGWIDAALERAA